VPFARFFSAASLEFTILMKILVDQMRKISTVTAKASNQHSVTRILDRITFRVSDVNAYSNVGVSYTINSGTDSAGLLIGL
jgi:hypothetical protein